MNPIDNYESWRSEAACLDVEDPEIFFPIKKSQKAAKAAKELCKRCVSRDDCLAYALEHEEPFGVWGGLTEDERKRLLSERKRVANYPRY